MSKLAEIRAFIDHLRQGTHDWEAYTEVDMLQVVVDKATVSTPSGPMFQVLNMEEIIDAMYGVLER